LLSQPAGTFHRVAPSPRLPSSGELAVLLEQLTAEHNVPGASAAIRRGDEISTAAAGVLNIRTGVEVTPGSLFQIGSNSKIYTATLVMQLVDEGKVDLDAPVETYLPHFRLAGGVAGGEITLRHLLTHTSGIDGGDYLADFGRGDDAVEKYVASLSEIGLVHPVGKYRSYCNAGTVVAGRIIEVITGLPWHEALMHRIIGPLGLAHTVTLPEEAILFRVAVGHIDASLEDDTPTVHPTWMLPRSLGPAGSVVNSSALDLASFGQLHLAGGVAPDGSRLLSRKSVEIMQEPQFSEAFRLGAGSSGIGWGLGQQRGVRTAAHDGGTLGQSSVLYLFPDHGVVFVCLTNGGRGGSVCAGLLAELLNRLAGIDLSLYAGVFERKDHRTTLAVVDGALEMTTEYEGWGSEQRPPPPPSVLRPIDQSRFTVFDGAGGAVRQAAFTEPDEHGRPRYFLLGRLARRINTEEK
jgi:CubicO group peptidase (beta-lactamase class C family)